MFGHAECRWLMATADGSVKWPIYRLPDAPETTSTRGKNVVNEATQWRWHGDGRRFLDLQNPIQPVSIAAASGKTIRGHLPHRNGGGRRSPSERPRDAKALPPPAKPAIGKPMFDAGNGGTHQETASFPLLSRAPGTCPHLMGREGQPPVSFKY